MVGTKPKDHLLALVGIDSGEERPLPSSEQEQSSSVRSSKLDVHVGRINNNTNEVSHTNFEMFSFG